MVDTTSVRTVRDTTAEESTTDSAEERSDRPSGATVLELDGVTRAFGDETAVDELSLFVKEGELLTLLGPSGCGKTTTLRLLAGLERPDSGTIRVRGDVVAKNGTFVQPEERDIGLIFQDFALFPHLSVGENVAYGIDDGTAEEIDERVEELLELVGLSGYRDQPPETLSGGQQQRVALARSLAPEPDVLLLDEPFSSLDVGLRKEMREEVRRILKEAGVTAISVTHDQEEALSISDRVAVIHDGNLEQIGRPEAVFQNPKSRFVAEFLGEAGFLEGELVDGAIDTPLGPVEPERLGGYEPARDGTEVDILVRPDDIRATPADAVEADGTVGHRRYTGPSFVYRIELDTGDVVWCEQNHVERFDMERGVAVDLIAKHPLAWFPRE